MAIANDIEDRKDVEQLRADLTHVSWINTMAGLLSSISHKLAQPVAVTTAHVKESLTAGRDWMIREASPTPL